MSLGYKQCTACGCAALDSDTYCVVCGAKFSLPEAASMLDLEEASQIKLASGKAPLHKAEKQREIAQASQKVEPGFAHKRYEAHAQYAKRNKRFRPTTLAFLVVLVAVALVGGIFSLGSGDGLRWLLPLGPKSTPAPAVNSKNIALLTFTDPIEPLAEIPEGFIAVTTKEELLAINNDLTANYILMNDIDLDCDPNNNWVPIGAIENRFYTSMMEYGSFTGIFEGNGHIISGLYISMPELVQTQVVAAGLFATVMDASIRNLAVSGCIELGNMPGMYTYAGGIAGANIAYYGQSSIVNCVFTGVITGAYYTGGIVGLNTAFSENTQALITHCKNAGTITGKMAGGIAGFQESNAENSAVAVRFSANLGSISAPTSGVNRVGGIAGCMQSVGTNAQAEVFACYNRGAVKGNDVTGGVVGATIAVNSSRLLLSDCYNWGEVSGKANGGGILAYNYAQAEHDSILINNCYNAGLVTTKGNKTRAAIVAVGKGAEEQTVIVTGCYYTAASGCKDQRAEQKTENALLPLLVQPENELFIMDVGSGLPVLRMPPVKANT